jgi:hypothetical protein
MNMVMGRIKDVLIGERKLPLVRCVFVQNDNRKIKMTPVTQ